MNSLEEDIYKTPEAKLVVPDTKPGRPVRAVMVGVLLDITLTLLFDLIRNIGAGVYIGFIRGAYGSDATIQEFISSAEPWGIYYNIGVALGIIATIIASYVCARLARKNVYRYASIMITIVIAMTIPFMQLSTPVERIVILNLLTFIAAIAGAWLYIYRNPDIQ
jgi:heme/copper-type cytochrome/quinol oxidase subunit 4